MEKQKTIGQSCNLKGKGLHTGKDVEIRFLPGRPNDGIIFRRTDIDGDNTIRAISDYVTDTSRGTTISNGRVTVRTIEHLMAAVSGCRIDNLIIEINCEEIPIIDGSASGYVRLLLDAGIVEQDNDRKVFNIRQKIEVYDKEKDVHISVEPCEQLKITCIIDYKSMTIPSQEVTMEKIEDFNVHFAPARTFAFLHELEPMLRNGLIKGGDLENAIIFIDHVISDEEQQRLSIYFNMPDIRVLEEGILNNVKLRFENEPAKHKLIDILGDLTLVGIPFTGHITAYRPGHKTNTDFAKTIRKYLMNGYDNSEKTGV
jgi:UDP-3-O-[3-hydroxymyristoyl] N-acetylglucosamine deacetylase/3-hydroxyacyl-[acyl-carrier-protein] dehydratase